MAAKAKSRKKNKESGSERPRAGSRRQSRARVSLPPPPSLRQELLLMAHSGAKSIQRALLTLVMIGVIAGIAFGIWSLRPTPSYSSENLTEGSSFDVVFRVDNKNPWFPLSNLKISCILAHVRASGIPTTLLEANDVRFPTGNAARLEPGESATFRCPFRELMRHPANDDPGIAQRAEIYFRGEYDEPLLGSFRLWDDSVRYFLNTRVLPPRWTSTPQG